jgi:maleylacetate reductase
MPNDPTNLKVGHFVIQAQERVLFGQPAENAVAAEADRYDAQRVFVVSTASLARLANGPLQRVIRGLGKRHAGTFDTIRAHTPREDVVKAATAAREVEADLLIAVGGGSVIDATKAMQMCLWLSLTTPESLEPFRAGASRDIARRIEPPTNPIRMISVSTTLSASDFTSQAGVTDTATHVKHGFSHRLFVPRSAILDPAATLDTPDWLLYCTGIRSVDHAVESWCSPLANPASEPLSLQGLRLLARALPRILAEPNDLDARLEAQFGMWQAVGPSASGVSHGASHGIGYVLGGTYGVAHGHTSCVMLPAVLRWNAVVNRERQQTLAETMSAPGREAADLSAELVHSLGQPGSLRAVNIRREDLDDIARRALPLAPVRANPRPIRTAEDVREILELAY